MVQYPLARDGGGDPVDAGSPGSLVVVAPPGVASVSVEIAGRPASNRRWCWTSFVRGGSPISKPYVRQISAEIAAGCLGVARPAEA